MPNKMIWNDRTKKMEKVGMSKGEGIKVSVSAELAKILKAFAIEDGYDFTGVSYVTEKDAKGKTKRDAKGKPVFVLEDGKPKKVDVPESTAKINSAVSDYVNVGTNLLIESRGRKQDTPTTRNDITRC